MRLVADSACDIKELEGMAFKAVPLTISTDNEEFCDAVSYTHLTLPTTPYV